MEKKSQSRKLEQQTTQEKNFFSFIFRQLCRNGGYQMQIPISDLYQAISKLPFNDDCNVYRKGFGNMMQCFKTHRYPFYTIENDLVIKMKEEICKNCGNEYDPKRNQPDSCPYYPKDYSTDSMYRVGLRDLYCPKGKQDHQPLFNIKKIQPAQNILE